MDYDLEREMSFVGLIVSSIYNVNRGKDSKVLEPHHIFPVLKKRRKPGADEDSVRRAAAALAVMASNEITGKGD